MAWRGPGSWIQGHRIQVRLLIGQPGLQSDCGHAIRSRNPGKLVETHPDEGLIRDVSIVRIRGIRKAPAGAKYGLQIDAISGAQSGLERKRIGLGETAAVAASGTVSLISESTRETSG